MTKGKTCGLTPLEACDRAAVMIKKAGFAFSHAGRLTHTTYYRFPGRSGTLRLSTHAAAKFKSRRFGPADVAVSAITFSHKTVYADGTLIMATQTIESAVAQGIGRFFLRSALLETKP